MSCAQICLFFTALLVWTLGTSSVGHTQTTQAVTLPTAKLKVRIPKGWLPAKPHAYLSYEMLWFHPQGARIVVASTLLDPNDTMDAWLTRIREAARARKITLSEPVLIHVARTQAKRLAGKTRTHDVQFVVFWHGNRVVFIQFACELNNRATCALDSDFSQVLTSLEPL